MTVAVPSWRNDVAAPVVLDQSPTLDPADGRQGRRGLRRRSSRKPIWSRKCCACAAWTRCRRCRCRASGAGAARHTDRRGSSAPRWRGGPWPRRAWPSASPSASWRAPTRSAFGDTPEALRLSNPIAADLDQLRPTPVATLALAAKRNAARGYPDVALFEVGPAFALDAPDGQRLVAAGLRAGVEPPRNWLAPPRRVDAMDAKADLWAVLAALGVPMEALQVTADAPAFLHPGRSGTVRQGPKTVLGSFGELHPGVLAALDLPGPMVAFELNLDAVADPKRRRKAAPDLPAFQPVRRDFAFLVEPPCGRQP